MFCVKKLSAGTDIFTVSKMLGHKNVKTTQIYSHIIDQRKKDTTARISLEQTDIKVITFGDVFIYKIGILNVIRVPSPGMELKNTRPLMY